MSILGKLHELSMYGLMTTIFCIYSDKLNLSSLFSSALHPTGFSGFFMCYLFWASILFIPVAVIGAYLTKYNDGGEGLTFHSDNIVVILFAHIGEELLGLFLTPFWFLKDLFTRNFNCWKIIDYSLYALELVFIAVGLATFFYL